MPFSLGALFDKMGMCFANSDHPSVPLSFPAKYILMMIIHCNYLRLS